MAFRADEVYIWCFGITWSFNALTEMHMNKSFLNWERVWARRSVGGWSVVENIWQQMLFLCISLVHEATTEIYMAYNWSTTFYHTIRHHCYYYYIISSSIRGILHHQHNNDVSKYIYNNILVLEAHSKHVWMYMVYVS